MNMSAMTEAQVAECLSVSTATLRSWRQRGAGPKFCRFGRAVRYMTPDIKAFVSGASVRPQSVARARTQPPAKAANADPC